MAVVILSSFAIQNAFIYIRKIGNRRAVMEEAKRYREPWEFPTDTDSFETIVQTGRVYVDKTDLIYRMTRNQCVFLSRPRRFGKSLLCSTLKAYFLGKKELFKGLAMETLEKEWVKYPVFHFNMSLMKNKTPEQMRYEMFEQVRLNAKDNGLAVPEGPTPGSSFQNLVRNAFEQTGHKAVIIIDEYDAALLHTPTGTDLFNEVQSIHQEFYITCKACSEYLRFVFITGITKFSHVSIFSELNNLQNISLNEDYATLCGITEAEIRRTFDNDIENLALHNGMTKEEMYDTLRWKYDGFHFSENSPGVYNPYSLMLVLSSRKLRNNWFGSATPSFLFERMKGFRTDIMKLNRTEMMPDSAFDMSIHEMDTALPLLYQSGYLTIKGYDNAVRGYVLGIPNDEVREGLFGNFLKMLTPLNTDQRMNMVDAMNRALRRGDVDAAMKALQSFLSGVPYMYEGKEILEDLERLEALHQRDLYILFNGMGLNLETEVKQAKGRVDMVVWLPDAIYIFEFKMRGTASSALAQIEKNLYDAPYMADPRLKVKVGVRFTCAKHTITSWKVAR